MSETQAGREFDLYEMNPTCCNCGDAALLAFLTWNGMQHQIWKLEPINFEEGHTWGKRYVDICNWAGNREPVKCPGGCGRMTQYWPPDNVSDVLSNLGTVSLTKPSVKNFSRWLCDTEPAEGGEMVWLVSPNGGCHCTFIRPGRDMQSCGFCTPTPKGHIMYWEPVSGEKGEYAEWDVGAVLSMIRPPQQ
jgi:hypothetical protein